MFSLISPKRLLYSWSSLIPALCLINTLTHIEVLYPNTNVNTSTHAYTFMQGCFKRTKLHIHTHSRLGRYCFPVASRGQTSHTGNEKQESQIWMEFQRNEGQSSLALSLSGSSRTTDNPTGHTAEIPLRLAQSSGGTEPWSLCPNTSKKSPQNQKHFGISHARPAAPPARP